MKRAVILLDFDGFICKAFYASKAKHFNGNVPSSPDVILNRLVYETVTKIKADEYIAFYCVSDHSWKKDEYPTYKANREQNEELGLYRDKVIEEWGELITRVPMLEADEVIAILSSYYIDDEVMIVSDDKDLKYIAEIYCKINPDTEPEYRDLDDKELFCQLLAGDSEDNVKGIPKMGMKTADKELSKRHYNITSVAQIYKEKGLDAQYAKDQINLILPLRYKENTKPVIYNILAETIASGEEADARLVYEVINGQKDYVNFFVDKVYNNEE